MNISTFLDFLRSRLGLLMAFVLVLVIVLSLATVLRRGEVADVNTLYQPAPPGTATSVERPTATAIASPPSPQPGTPPLPQLSIRVADPTNKPGEVVAAPYGRLLRCQLVNTVDSANINTPIIALVTDDLWYDARLMVPAGTEVHGRANLDRMRERIVADGNWTLVWQTGEELVVHGIALDREEHPSLKTWGITDGSAGLRGEVLHSEVLAEVKLFLASFMSGMALGLQDTYPTLVGTEIPGTARNAALNGVSSVLNRYAEDLAQVVRRDGIYIRVPAGKQMYLYLTERLEPPR